MFGCQHKGGKRVQCSSQASRSSPQTSSDRWRCARTLAWLRGAREVAMHRVLFALSRWRRYGYLVASVTSVPLLFTPCLLAKGQRQHPRAPAHPAHVRERLGKRYDHRGRADPAPSRCVASFRHRRAAPHSAYHESATVVDARDVRLAELHEVPTATGPWWWSCVRRTCACPFCHLPSIAKQCFLRALDNTQAASPPMRRSGKSA